MTTIVITSARGANGDDNGAVLQRLSDDQQLCFAFLRHCGLSL